LELDVEQEVLKLHYAVYRPRSGSIKHSNGEINIYG